jgi:hypothetical protein
MGSLLTNSSATCCTPGRADVIPTKDLAKFINEHIIPRKWRGHDSPDDKEGVVVMKLVSSFQANNLIHTITSFSLSALALALGS